MMQPPNKGKEPMRAPSVQPQSSATGGGLIVNKSMGAPVRPMPHQAKASNAGPNNMHTAGPSRPTAGATITLVKPPPSRTSMRASMQRAPLAQSMLQGMVTPAPKPAKDELTKLQRRIAMGGGSASPQIRPEDVELPDISSE